MAVSYAVFEIKRDIGRQVLIFHLLFHLTCTIICSVEPIQFFVKILIQTVQWCKNIAEKFKSVRRVQHHHRQTTDGRSTRVTSRT